jgi:hypothetical protein
MSERQEATSLPEIKTEEIIIAKPEQSSWNPASYSAK